MENKFKWSSIVLVVVLLVTYTHCDLMITPQNAKVNYKNKNSSSTSYDTSSTAPSEISTPSTDYANAYSYYEEVVSPALQAQNCLLCHSSNGGAPISVGEYDQLKALMMNSTNYQGSTLNMKMIGSMAHAGGVKCANSTEGICEKFANWYALEFSQLNPPVVDNPPTNSGSGVMGSVDVISSLGKINGWAGDSFNVNSTLQVEFYLDGPKGSGTFLGSVSANLPGGSVTGNHGFIFFIPSQYRDGSAHQLYGYAIDSNQQEIALANSPQNIYTYAPSIEGYDFYQNNVKPLLDSRCSSCHAVNYDQHFNSLLSPSPGAGGSATNNEMINMPAGSHNGKGHPGGNICGNKNNSPCSEIQAWWQVEFQ
ncbi:hypothetical protein [Halobacteriovorax sp. HLS]|uniref:hypothetical protein n=1 Tax=Halobacteriovorax sp. HLS TaxID=2234000 RepID=UPI000FD9497F|nr:hypothetical protein [Halobacteriovorax sp. HLS]